MKDNVFFCFLVCIIGFSAGKTPAAVSGHVNAELGQEVDRIRRQYGFPGMTFHYLVDDEQHATVYSGYADLATGILVHDRPRMLGASTGKSFVGALTIALALEGKLSLDTPVSQWLGHHHWFRRLANHETTTLRHLLKHQAGIADHVYDRGFQNAFSRLSQNEETPFTPEQLISFILDKPPLFPAGTGWAYSDTGYLVIGLVLEQVTGKPYYEEIQQRFLDPLGLIDTTPANSRTPGQLAVGYVSPENPFGLPARTMDKKGSLYWHPGVEWTGGGWVTSSRDLAHWGNALFNRQSTCWRLSPEAVRRCRNQL